MKHLINAINLEEYQKDRNDKLDVHSTSVTIEKRHAKFLDDKNLNLSKLVRDFLDELMQQKGDKSSNKK